jgi:hypothetical protein
MTNHFDLNKFNALISQASDSILCNSECQKQRQSEKLKQKYQNAQTTSAMASNEESIAEKNYVVFTQGQSAYNDLLDNKLEEKAELITNKFTENFDSEVLKINSQIDTYGGLLINFRNIIDLLIKYKKENNELFEELKYETNDVMTNERKTFYEDQKINSLTNFYYYIILFFYAIFVVCFGIFSLIYPSQTNWKIRIAILLAFIALPFFSSWILGAVIYFLYKVYNLLPKNVYT